MNTEEEIKLRKYRDSLGICGGVVIVFGLIIILQMLLGLYFSDSGTAASVIQDSISQMESDAPTAAVVIIWLAVIVEFLVICVVAFLPHLYMGIKALRESRGTEKSKRNNHVYLVMAGAFFLLEVLSFSAIFWLRETTVTFTSVVRTILALTMAYMYFDMIRSAIMVRKLKQEMEAEAVKAVEDETKE